MKKVLKIIVFSVSDFLLLIYHVLSLIFERGTFRNRIVKSKVDKMIVLANGPSLKDELPELAGLDNSNIDFVVLNYFGNDAAFFKIKPKHYCFADPMFFRKTHRSVKALELLKALDDNVNWAMNIYIPSNLHNNFLKFSSLTNKNINIIKVNTTQYKGRNKLIKHFLFKNGLSTPNISTVANLAIYVALNKGPKEIDVYGIDHTFFDGLCVNDENQVCTIEKHFYNNSTNLKPIRRNDNDKVFKMSEYVTMIGDMFKSHDALSGYAKYLDIKLINKTKESLVDSYSRK